MNSRNAPSPSGDDDRDGSPSLVRASKRQRCSNSGNDAAVNNNDDDTTIDKLTLPPEMWANVMKYLPFDNILSCCAVSRSMLHETMPLLTKIQINKAAQMNLAVASRFRDVTDIHINSLLLREIDEEFEDVNFDFESRIRVLPFLFCFMKTLERVHFGAKDNLGNVIEGFSPTNACFWEESDGYPYEAPWDLMMAFIDSLSGAFICGALPQRLQISGLCCPCIRDRRSTQCATCIRACKSFPLESVARFHSDGSSAENARSGRAFGLDVCLPIAQVESIIESRPGGKELLLSDERLFRLLESGRRWEIGDDESGKLVIVQYKKTQRDEMKRVITYAGLDVKKLPTEKLQAAVLKSFEKGTILPPKIRRYVSEQSLVCLKDDVDLCIDMTEICGSTSEFLPSLKCVVNVLVQYYDEEALHNTTERWFEYEDIVGDCFTLIRRFLELDKDALTRDDMNNLLPCLIEALNDTNRSEAASALGLIYTNGPGEQRQMIINAGVISKFVGLLNLSEESITKIALSGLVDILADEKKEHVEAMVQAGGVPKLVEMLHSSDDLMVDKAQSLLVITANHNIQKVIDAKAHEGLFRILLSDVQTESFPKCSILLRKIFEVDNPPIQQAVNANLIPRLVEILNTTEDAVVQKNLAFVCIALASGATEENIDSLMRETGLLTLLVDLQYSSLGDVSEAAITGLEHIANIRSSFDAESGDALAWGEYAFLDLVDSDDDGSSVSFEEALEVSDEEVALEEQQAEAGGEPSIFYDPPLSSTTDEDCDVCSSEETNESTVTPSLLGIPRKLLQTILIYATQNRTEVNILASVCKEFSVAVETYDDIAPREGFTFRHPCLGYRKVTLGLRNIRKFQKGSDNEIMEILCDWKDEVDGTSVMSSEKLHILAANVMKRMNHGGPSASFRLRGDTVDYLFELLQGYMIKRLEHALLMAIHGNRTQVERRDFLLLPSQEMQSKCNIEDNYHGDGPSYVSSCSLPSNGILWRWPENDCRDLLQPGDGRRIIRRLAYKAGIVQMTSGLFEVAEAELLHTLGILLVEAYESSVDIAKTVNFLEPDEELTYGITNLPGSVDMFFKPPPFCESSGDHSSADDAEGIEYENERKLYTIVPGQISAAAKKRGIRPHHVYEDYFYPNEEEMEAEKAYYYKGGLKDCESRTDSLEENFIPSKKFVGAKKGFVFTMGKKGLGYYKDVVPSCVVVDLT